MSNFSSFSELKKLSGTLKEQAKQRELEKQKEAQEKARKAKETAMFSSAMSELGVRPLASKFKNVADTKAAKPKAQVLHQVLEDDNKLRHHQYLSDELDGANFVQDHKGAGFYRSDLSPDLSIRLSRNEWSVASTLDLHGMSTDQARDEVITFIDKALKREHRVVCIIHGRTFSGTGTLWRLVPRWIKQIPSVMAYTRVMSDGAVNVLLKVRKYDDEL